MTGPLIAAAVLIVAVAVGMWIGWRLGRRARGESCEEWWDCEEVWW